MDKLISEMNEIGNIQTLNFLVIGNGGVGKTFWIQKQKEKYNQKGSEIILKTNYQNFHLNLHESCGNFDFDNKNFDGIIFIFNSYSRESFIYFDFWYSQLLEKIPNLENIPIILINNENENKKIETIKGKISNKISKVLCRSKMIDYKNIISLFYEKESLENDQILVLLKHITGKDNLLIIPNTPNSTPISSSPKNTNKYSSNYWYYSEMNTYVPNYITSIPKSDKTNYVYSNGTFSDFFNLPNSNNDLTIEEYHELYAKYDEEIGEWIYDPEKQKTSFSRYLEMTNEVENEVKNEVIKNNLLKILKGIYYNEIVCDPLLYNIIENETNLTYIDILYQITNHSLLMEELRNLRIDIPGLISIDKFENFDQTNQSYESDSSEYNFSEDEITTNKNNINEEIWKGWDWSREEVENKIENIKNYNFSKFSYTVYYRDLFDYTEKIRNFEFIDEERVISCLDNHNIKRIKIENITKIFNTTGINKKNEKNEMNQIILYDTRIMNLSVEYFIARFQHSNNFEDPINDFDKFVVAQFYRYRLNSYFPIYETNSSNLTNLTLKKSDSLNKIENLDETYYYTVVYFDELDNETREITHIDSKDLENLLENIDRTQFLIISKSYPNKYNAIGDPITFYVYHHKDIHLSSNEVINTITQHNTIYGKDPLSKLDLFIITEFYRNDAFKYTYSIVVIEKSKKDRMLKRYSRLSQIELENLLNNGTIPPENIELISKDFETKEPNNIILFEREIPMNYSKIHEWIQMYENDVKKYGAEPLNDFDKKIMFTYM